MSDWFSTALDMQREIIRAQKAQIKAAEKMLDGAQDLKALHDAGKKAAEANLAIWEQWANFWGWR